ncbi:MAG: phage portal protein, partial [Endomicrobia bacterium]|nr:phage portal protein [Endomicrobiia bacterium]
YDDKYITYFIQDNYGNYILDPDEPKNPQEHLFDKVPIIEFPNNNERLNDFYKVENLIDAYDRVISDVQNEIEEFRQAYLKFTGAEIDAETISKARQTGAFSLPDGADAEYLVKNINSEFIEKHKKELRDNIFRFSKTIDTNSETFTGSVASGEARKWIMTALEFKASIKEMKFRKSLYEMFSVLSTAWKKKGINITANDIQITFDRNFPQELKLEAEILEKLMGRISTRTALELFSPVRDVDAEIKRIQEEKEGLIDLDKIKIEEV